MMAPSPEHDNEPKAPDKNENKSNDSGDIRNTNELLVNQLSPPANPDPEPQESSVSTLDDGQLKALLDEAINYKTPKDREGKSKIFKVLLQEAEEDERNARAASASGSQLARYYNTAARKQKNRNKETSASTTLTHGGSLQDLAQSDLYTDTHNVSGCTQSSSGRRPGAGARRHRNNPHGHHPVTGHKTVSVSARQREGGSLPSNVNAGATNLLFDEEEYDQPSMNNNSNTIQDDYSSTDTDTRSSVVQISNEFMNESDSVIAQNKPEYTIVELGPVNIEEDDGTELTTLSHNNNILSTTPNSFNSTSIDLSLDPEETRSLLMKETRSYSTIESNESITTTTTTATPTSPSSASTINSNDVHLPKYQYPHGDLDCVSDKEESIVPNNKRNPNYEQISRHQYFNPLEEYNKLPRIKYTSMAKVEIDGLNSQINTNVDKAISFSQFSTERDAAGSLQLDTEYSSVRCIVDGTTLNSTNNNSGPENMGQNNTVGARTQTLTKLSSDYRLLTLPNSKTMERFKGLDENGNSVQTSTSSASLLDAKKKSKKSKVDRNVSVLDAKDIAGHQAAIIQDIDQLVKYIEENDDKSVNKGGGGGGGGGGGKHSHNKNHEHVKNNISSNNARKDFQPTTAQATIESKKPKRIKTKSETSAPKSTLKKSNSLEEISKTKFADLMNTDNKTNSRIKKQSTSEDGDFTLNNNNNHKKDDEKMSSNCDPREIRDRRSWGSEDSQQYMLSKHQRDSFTAAADLDTATAITLISQETAEFHVVTKKKKSKKRTPSSRLDEKNTHHERFNYHYHKIDQNVHQQHHYHRDKVDNIKAPSNCEKDHYGRSYHRNVFATENSVPTRRKSACSVPPSDKSADSSDVDSVHSLPAASTRRKPNNTDTTSDIHKNTEFNDTLAALSANSSPGNNTSYADIARNHNLMNSQQMQQQQGWKSSMSNQNSIALRSSEHFPELFTLNEIKPQIEDTPNDITTAIITITPSPITTTTTTTTTSSSINLNYHREREEFPSLHHQHHRSLSTGSSQNFTPQQLVATAGQSNSALQLELLPTNAAATIAICADNNTTTTTITTTNNNNNNNTSVVAVVVVDTNNSSREQFQSRSIVIPPNNNKQSTSSSVNKSEVRVSKSNLITTTNNNVPFSSRRSSSHNMQLSNQNIHNRSRATGVITASRPAVIILNDSSTKQHDALSQQRSPSEPIQVSGLTFGFELNEQLLNGDEFCENPFSNYQQQSVNVVPNQAEQFVVGLANENIVGQHFSARYLAPSNDVRDRYNHDKIVQFIGMAWEELINDNKGKIQYYNGQ